MNDIHQILTYADDVNLIRDDIRTNRKNTDVRVLLNACKDFGLAVNTGKTKYAYMEVGRHRDMMANVSG